ncbi:MAG TPA: MmcQ/YjbR family DNA-binding protein [Solirubrobacteraceae bacterium]|nr:MmcQ/YjbR family DNA-binding protein [Solirubrobacteraceae bacterium]
MTPAELRDFCLSLPGAVEEFPFGPDTHVYKSRGKIFAISAMRSPLHVSLKCDPDLAADLRNSYSDVLPGYHLNKRHWNTVTCNASVPDRLVRDMIEDSYDLVTKRRREPR